MKGWKVIYHSEDEFARRIQRDRNANPEYTNEILFRGFHLMVPGEQGQAPRVIYAEAHQVDHKTDDKKVHTVVFGYCREDDTYMVWCGDQWLKGTRKRQAETIAGVDNLKDLSESAKELVLAEVVERYGSRPDDSPCHFWRNGADCKHVHHASSGFDFDGLKSRAIGHWAQGRVRGRAGPNVDGALARYAFSLNVLVEGEKGTGKTVSVDRYCHEAGVDEVVFLGGHQGLEAVDILGYNLKGPNGEIVWKDGALSEAFRKAAAGKKVALMIDEILRIPSRETSVLIAALSPGHDGRMRLRTQRVLSVNDGVAQEETLYCTRDNLWVVATTNTGPGYHVEDMDDALADRFPIVVRMETDSKTLRLRLAEAAAEHEIPDKHVDTLMAFYDAAARLRNHGELTRLVNTRHMMEVLLQSRDHPMDVLLRDRVLLWSDRDALGVPLEAHAELIESAITKALAA